MPLRAPAMSASPLVEVPCWVSEQCLKNFSLLFHITPFALNISDSKSHKLLTSKKNGVMVLEGNILVFNAVIRSGAKNKGNVNCCCNIYNTFCKIFGLWRNTEAVQIAGRERHDHHLAVGRRQRFDLMSTSVFVLHMPRIVK